MQVSSQNEEASPSPVLRREDSAASGIEVYSIVEQIIALSSSESADKEEAREKQRFLEQKLLHENLRLALTQ